MKNYLEYIKESNSDEFAKIFAQISKFSNELKNSFQSTIDKNKRESNPETKAQTQVQPTKVQPTNVQAQSKEKADAEGNKIEVNKQYIYNGPNGERRVKILNLDVKGSPDLVGVTILSKNSKEVTNFLASPKKLRPFSSKQKQKTIA